MSFQSLWIKWLRVRFWLLLPAKTLADISFSRV